jgi:hypothetical protein
MIYTLTGKLGAGKGLELLRIYYAEIVSGVRDVVTNLPLSFAPWVNGRGIPQLGVSAYLSRQYGEGFDAQARTLLLPNIDDGPDMFRWRRDSDTGEWFKLPLAKDSEGNESRIDFEPIKSRACRPVLILTDEAWQFFPSGGNRWTRSPILPFYARQQRKLGDEWFIATQHVGDLDAVIIRIAQHHIVCRNHGMERLGVFKQPGVVRTVTFLTRPDRAGAVRSHEAWHRIDVKGIGQTYDTTAGVGVSGGFGGDAGAKRRGMPFFLLPIAIVLLVLGLIAVPLVLSRSGRGFLSRSLSGGRGSLTNAPVKSGGFLGVTMGSGGRTNTASVSAARSGIAKQGASPFRVVSNVWTYAFTCVDGQSKVWLSDGNYLTKWLARDETGVVTVDGRVYLAMPDSCVPNNTDMSRGHVSELKPAVIVPQITRPVRLVEPLFSGP